MIPARVSPVESTCRRHATWPPPEMVVQELADAGFAVHTWKVDTDGDLLAVEAQKPAGRLSPDADQ